MRGRKRHRQRRCFDNFSRHILKFDEGACRDENQIREGLLELREKRIQMGFLLDWLHFPTLEWYRSAGSLCPPTAADRFQTPFLSLHSGKLSRVSLLQGVEVNCESKIVQFITVLCAFSAMGWENMALNMTRNRAYFVWAPGIPNREGKAIFF